MKSFFSSKKRDLEENLEIDINSIPKHIAIIMDGNGRWAKERNLPRTMGHKAGVETIREIVKECSNLGVETLTLYAFSTENWNRPKEEVSALMNLLVQYLKKEVSKLHKNDVVVKCIGDIDKLPDICVNELKNAYEKTKNNKGLILNLALNYGGRDEITNAVKNIVKDVNDGVLKQEDINQQLISKYMYTKGMKDPDLIIRPSGEKRLSNFLLWQCAYSEFWYSDIKWPDFKKQQLHKAIKDFQNRDRRFGKVKEGQDE